MNYNNEDEFKKELFKAHGVENNPKKDACYRIAYELGHSYGLHEVAYYFADLVELIQ